MRGALLVCVCLLSSFAGGAIAQSAGGGAVMTALAMISPWLIQKGNGTVWADVDGLPPLMWNFSDRLLVGNAAYNVPNTRTGRNATWVPDWKAGANWAPRDAQFISMATRGNLAVVGMSRASDSDSVPLSSAPIGIAGFGIGDSKTGRSARGGYFDLQYESGNYGYGIEIAAKNKGRNVVPNPYHLPTGMTMGAQFGTGDPSYGGPNANPLSAAIFVNGGEGTSTWNSGLLFAKSAITGCDGRGTTCKAIEMTIGQQICWFSSSSNSACIGGASPDESAVVLNIPSYTPTFSSQPCSAGSISWDSDYVYICTATNKWKRSALSSF